MNDERFLKDWLRDTSEPNADPRSAADEIMARLSTTPRRRRWLPWPPARHRAADDALPPTDRRTRLMFNPVSATTIGVLVLAASGAFYLAQSSSEESAPASAAEAASTVAPNLFTGSLANDPACSTSMKVPELEVVPGLVKERGRTFYCFLWETTDPRLNGSSTIVWNSDIIHASSDTPGGRIESGRELITAANGTWVGTLTKLIVDEGLELESGWYVGGGGYEGLSAYIMLQGGGDSLWGYVSDDPPPMPEEAPLAE